jgi:hypothetical protein
MEKGHPLLYTPFLDFLSRIIENRGTLGLNLLWIDLMGEVYLIGFVKQHLKF